MGNKPSGNELLYSIKKNEKNRLGFGSFAEVYMIKSKDKMNVFAAKIFK